MARRGLRGRLDRLEADAHGTMGAARAEMGNAVELLRGFLEECEDGLEIQIVRRGDASIMDFIQGKTDELPFRLRIVAREETPPPASS